MGAGGWCTGRSGGVRAGGWCTGRSGGVGAGRWCTGRSAGAWGRGGRGLLYR